MLTHDGSEIEAFVDGMGNLETVEWKAPGRNATRKEIEPSIKTGLTILQNASKQEAVGLEALEREYTLFRECLTD